MLIHKRRYRWNALRFFCNIALLISVVIGCWLLFSSTTAAKGTPEQVIVRSGDSLWSIAVRIRPQDDPRKIVESIRDANHLTSLNVIPGQMIVVP